MRRFRHSLALMWRKANGSLLLNLYRGWTLGLFPGQPLLQPRREPVTHRVLGAASRLDEAEQLHLEVGVLHRPVHPLPAGGPWNELAAFQRADRHENKSKQPCWPAPGLGKFVATDGIHLFRVASVVVHWPQEAQDAVQPFLIVPMNYLVEDLHRPCIVRIVPN